MKPLVLPILLLVACQSSRPPSGVPQGDAMEIVPLQHVSAEEVARILNDRLAELGQTSSGDRPAVGPDEAGPRAMADTRTNSILIVAHAQDMRGLLELVARLDSETH